MASFDKIIHEPVRLRIITLLAAAAGPCSFNHIRQELNLTAGNLSVQLRNLESAGYIAITKTFRHNKPLTTVSLTTAGSEALQNYVTEMEAILKSLK